MFNKDNFQYGLYYQNVGRSTILIYHSDYYSERKITKMLIDANFSNYDFNVQVVFGRTAKRQSMIDIVDSLESQRYKKETFEGNTQIRSV